MGTDDRDSRDDRDDREDRQQLLTALTTEHFTLQGARSQTIGETSARASVYMLSVSSALVALGFVSQASTGTDAGTGTSAVFVAFALTILPTLYVLGCAAYVRIVECSAEDLRYAVAINRIRSYYLEVAGDRADLFLLSAHDDAVGAFANMGLPTGRRRSAAFAFSTAIAIVNGVVGGASVAVGVGSIDAVPVGAAVAVGVGVAALSILLWVRHSHRLLAAAAAAIEPLSPTPEATPAPTPAPTAPAAPPVSRAGRGRR